MFSSAVYPLASRSSTTCSTTFCVRATSSFGTVNEMSVWPSVDTFCTIMSTFTESSARARNRRAAIPGRSGTCVIVIFASLRSWVTPEMIACSMTSSSCTTQVPGSHEKLERTWTGTPWFRANSTDRSASTRPPVAAMSSISSYETRSSLRAFATTRGSAV